MSMNATCPCGLLRRWLAIYLCQWPVPTVEKVAGNVLMSMNATSPCELLRRWLAIYLCQWLVRTVEKVAGNVLVSMNAISLIWYDQANSENEQEGDWQSRETVSELDALWYFAIPVSCGKGISHLDQRAGLYSTVSRCDEIRYFLKLQCHWCHPWYFRTSEIEYRGVRIVDTWMSFNIFAFWSRSECLLMRKSTSKPLGLSTERHT